MQDCAKITLAFLENTHYNETKFYIMKRGVIFLAEQSSVQSLDRAFQLLELLCRSQNGMSIAALSTETGLHKSTVHRLLSSMASRGYVQRDSEGATYFPGMHICELSSYILQNLDIVSRARAPMEHLSRRTGETVHLVVLQGAEIVYIHKVESVYGAIRMFSRIGMRRPVFCTGVGKAILSTRTTEEASSLWHQCEIRSYTPDTITNQNLFMRELQRISTLGYAMDNEENEVGVRCIAAAIPDWSGRAQYAISISAPVSRMTDERIAALIPELLFAQSQISATLGGHPNKTS